MPGERAIERIREACPICEGGSPAFSFELSRGPVSECPQCGVFAAHDKSIDPEQDRQFHEDLDESRYVEYFKPFRKRQYREVLTRLEAPSDTALLDVGASYGWMIEVGLELGFDSYGIEPSPVVYEPPLRDRIVIRTLEEHAAQARQRYGLITLWHVLEHVRDPIASARHIQALLTEGGFAVIAVPNAAGRMYKLGLILAKRFGSSRLMEELWYTHNPNMHRYYPTAEAVARILDYARLQVVDTYTLDAFDWGRLWRRSTNVVGRSLLRITDPAVQRSRFTSSENLIVEAQQKPLRNKAQ